MPLQIIAFVWGGAALVGLLVAGAVALNWERIIVKLKRRTLAVLGARRVGKTTLLQFLTNGQVAEKYEATEGAVKTSGKRFSLGELEMVVKAGKDVGGGVDTWGQWELLTKKADHVLYLLRFDQLKDATASDRIRRDLEQIRHWLKRRGAGRPPFWLVITHLDLDPRCRTPDTKKTEELTREIESLPLIREILTRARDGDARGGLIAGSLKSNQDAELMVASWLKRVAGDA